MVVSDNFNLFMPFDVVKLVSEINLDISTRKEIEKELIISQSNAINIFDFLRCQTIKKYKYTIDSKVIRRKYLDINDSDTVKKTYN